MSDNQCYCGKQKENNNSNHSHVHSDVSGTCGSSSGKDNKPNPKSATNNQWV